MSPPGGKTIPATKEMENLRQQIQETNERLASILVYIGDPSPRVEISLYNPDATAPLTYQVHDLESGQASKSKSLSDSSKLEFTLRPSKIYNTSETGKILLLSTEGVTLFNITNHSSSPMFWTTYKANGDPNPTKTIHPSVPVQLLLDYYRDMPRGKIYFLII